MSEHINMQSVILKNATSQQWRVGNEDYFLFSMFLEYNLKFLHFIREKTKRSRWYWNENPCV